MLPRAELVKNQSGKWGEPASTSLFGATAVALAMYDSARFLAADHYGGLAVGLIVTLTGLRVLTDARLELMDTMPGREMSSAFAQPRSRSLRARRRRELRAENRLSTPRVSEVSERRPSD